MLNQYYKYILSAVLVIVIDSIFLSNMAPYYNQLVLKTTTNPLTFNFSFAIPAYLFIVFGLWYFVIHQNDIFNWQAVINAAILGWVVYGVYEFTNAGIIKGWNEPVIYVDVLWGGVLYGLSTYLTYSILNRL